MTTKIKTLSIWLATLLVGIIIGGYLFSDTQPRSVIALHDCQSRCLSRSDFVGLLASAGIKVAPGLLPGIVRETDDTIVILHSEPVQTARVHYVLIPKRDIKHIGEFAAQDIPSLVDIFSVVAEIVAEERFSGYRIWSTGLNAQGLTYLHFHLAGS